MKTTKKYWLWCDTSSCPRFGKTVIVDSLKQAREYGQDICPKCFQRRKGEVVFVDENGKAFPRI